MLAVVIYIVIPVLCLLGVHTNANEKNMISKDASLAMRGLGMLFIIYTHMAQSNTCPETYYFYVSGVIGVAICFLVSGYGLHISYTKKVNYLDRFWKSKILRLLLPFLVAFTCYWLIKYIQDESIDIALLLKGLFTITFPGVTLWYLKIQLLMYAAFFFAYRYAESTNCKIACVFAVAFIYTIMAAVCGVPMFWYNTCLFFPLGLLLAEHREIIMAVIRKKTTFAAAIGLNGFLYGVLYFFGRLGIDWLIDQVYMLSFCVGLLWIVQRFTGFRVLEVIGKYSIEVYLFHIVVRGECFSATNPAAYVLTPLICVLIGIPVHWLTDKITNAFSR